MPGSSGVGPGATAATMAAPAEPGASAAAGAASAPSFMLLGDAALGFAPAAAGGTPQQLRQLLLLPSRGDFDRPPSGAVRAAGTEPLAFSGEDDDLVGGRGFPPLGSSSSGGSRSGADGSGASDSDSAGGGDDEREEGTAADAPQLHAHLAAGAGAGTGSTGSAGASFAAGFIPGNAGYPHATAFAHPEFAHAADFSATPSRTAPWAAAAAAAAPAGPFFAAARTPPNPPATAAAGEAAATANSAASTDGRGAKRPPPPPTLSAAPGGLHFPSPPIASAKRPRSNSARRGDVGGEEDDEDEGGGLGAGAAEAPPSPPSPLLTAEGFPIVATHPVSTAEDLVRYARDLTLPAGLRFSAFLHADSGVTANHASAPSLSALCLQRCMRCDAAIGASGAAAGPTAANEPATTPGGRAATAASAAAAAAAAAETPGSAAGSPTASTAICANLALRQESRLQLARVAELAARELRIAGLQHHCFRMLRTLARCFPHWAAHSGQPARHDAPELVQLPPRTTGVGPGPGAGGPGPPPRSGPRMVQLAPEPPQHAAARHIDAHAGGPGGPAPGAADVALTGAATGASAAAVAGTAAAGGTSRPPINPLGNLHWHSNELLAAGSLRAMTPYCLFFDELWDEVHCRLLHAGRQVVKSAAAAAAVVSAGRSDSQDGPADSSRARSTRNVPGPAASTSPPNGTAAAGTADAGGGAASVPIKSETAAAARSTLDSPAVNSGGPQWSKDCPPTAAGAEASAASSTPSPGSSGVRPMPQGELSSALLQSLLFQCDCTVLSQVLLLLDALRRRKEPTYLPLSGPAFSEGLSSFAAAQALHAQHQAPHLFISGVLFHFRSAGELAASAGAVGGGQFGAVGGAGAGGAGLWNRSTLNGAVSRRKAFLMYGATGPPPSSSGGPLPPGRRMKKHGAPAVPPARTGSVSSAGPGGFPPTSAGSAGSTAYAQAGGGGENANISPASEAHISPLDRLDHGGVKPPTLANGRVESSLSKLTASLYNAARVKPEEGGALQPPQQPTHSSALDAFLPDGRRRPGADDFGAAGPPSVGGDAAGGAGTYPQNFAAAAVAAYSAYAAAGGITVQNGVVCPSTPPPGGGGGAGRPGGSIGGLNPSAAAAAFNVVSAAVAAAANGGGAATPSPVAPGGAGNEFELPRDPECFKSQVKGVYYDDTSNRWCASWHERKTGKKRSRYFAVKKFGFSQAKTHAMDARLEAEESGECAPTNIN